MFSIFAIKMERFRQAMNKLQVKSFNRLNSLKTLQAVVSYKSTHKFETALPRRNSWAELPYNSKYIWMIDAVRL